MRKGSPPVTQDTLQSPPHAPPPTGRPNRGLSAALRFLLPPGYEPIAYEPATMRRASHWFVPLGFVIGLIWIGVFRSTWRLYGEVGSIRPVPALAVVLVECLLTGPFLIMGLARTIHLLAGDKPRRPDEARNVPLSPVGTLVLCLSILAEFVFILSLPAEGGWWPQREGWKRYLNLMYPQPIYQPLLLAPIWGRWAILLAATIGRTAHGADATTVALCSEMTTRRLLRRTIIPLVLTAFYCGRSHNYMMGVIVALIVFCAAYLVSVVMAVRGGGQTRQSLYASGLVGQLAFLAVYRALWRFIHL